MLKGSPVGEADAAMLFGVYPVVEEVTVSPLPLPLRETKSAAILFELADPAALEALSIEVPASPPVES